MTEIEIVKGLKLRNEGGFYLVIINNNGNAYISITKEIYDRFLNLKLKNISNREIEKKFLVKNPPDLDFCDFFDIEQFYLLKDDIAFNSLRARKSNESYFLTFKSGKGLSRIEEEFEISCFNFEYCEKIRISKNIKKTRYRYLLKKSALISEIDFFKDSYDGLIVVEVEFVSEEEANNFLPPFWFGREVTNEKEYLNITMAFS